MFCVECGREEELIGSLCKECYSKKHAKAELPDHVDITLCAHCSSMETDRGWKDVGSVREAAEIALKSAIVMSDDAQLVSIDFQLAELDERNMRADVAVSLGSKGISLERNLTTTLRLKRGSCTECSKKQGRYYEAILQVRGSDKGLSKEEERSIEQSVKDKVASHRKSSREVFISKIEKVKGGLDFYFGTIPAAKSIARNLQETLCADYKESSSLWGRRDGKDIYRMTFLVRLPGFSKGDVVEHDSRMLYVRSMSRGIVRAVDLATGEERTIKPRTAGECSLERPKAELLQAVVLMEKPGEVQVLDPETMSVLDVRVAPGFRRKGDQIRFAKTKVGAFGINDEW